MRKLKILLLVLLICFIPGCATTHRTNPKFAKYFETPKKVAIVTPDIKINKLTAGGVSELIDEWSEQAKGKVLSAMQSELKKFPYITVLRLDEEKLNTQDKDFFKEEKGLFNALAYSIVAHTYLPGSTFQHKISNFDYTFGEEISKLSMKAQSDALLFCAGTNYIWTAGRVCLATAGILVTAVTGVAVIVPAGPEWLAVSLVDAKTGDVLWFDYVILPGDLRDEYVDTQQMKRVFSSFPKNSK